VSNNGMTRSNATGSNVLASVDAAIATMMNVPDTGNMGAAAAATTAPRRRRAL